MGLKKYNTWNSSVGNSVMCPVIVAGDAQLLISRSMISLEKNTVAKFTCLHFHWGIIFLTSPTKLQQMIAGPIKLLLGFQ